MINELITQPNLNLSKEQIITYCQRWHITQLALFGSVLRDDFSPHSDIDILVTFHPDAQWGLFDLVRMEDELATLTNRKIDLLTKASIEQSRNPLRRQEILQTAQVIYES